MKKISACARNYPKPGGRVVMLEHLVNAYPSMKVISYDSIKEPFKKLKYNLKCFRELKKQNPDIVLGMGLATDFAMLYAKLYKKESIFNTSGLRYKGHNIFFPNVFSETVSLLLAKKILVPSYENKEFILKYLPFLSKKIKVIPEGVKSWEKKAHKGFNIGVTRVEDPKVYDEILANYKKFGDVNIYFIKPRVIQKIEKGKLKDLKIKRMNEVLPILDCLFILPTDKEDFHSSTVLEALGTGIPFFITDIWFLKQIKQTKFLLKSNKIGEILSKFHSFRNNKEEHIKDFKWLSKEILSEYDLEKTMNEWKKEIS